MLGTTCSCSAGAAMRSAASSPTGRSRGRARTKTSASAFPLLRRSSEIAHRKRVVAGSKRGRPYAVEINARRVRVIEDWGDGVVRLSGEDVQRAPWLERMAEDNGGYVFARMVAGNEIEFSVSETFTFDDEDDDE